MRAFISKFGAFFIVIIAASGFFLFSASFNFLSQENGFIKWLSPDETANYTVAKLYAETDQLAFFEKYNLIAQDIIHPRSFRSDWGWIKPVSFLGLPILYGKITALIGSNSLPYLTPFFGAVGLIFFYLLIKKIFGRDNALISTILAASFPVLIYYSARSMFHNVLFISALIVGLYFSVRMIERRDGQSYLYRHGKSFLFALAGGLGIGLALITRTSELLWVGPLLIFLWLANIRRVGLTRLFFFVYGLFVPFLPIFYWNSILYGSFFFSGYPELNNSLFSLQQAGSSLATTTLAGRLNEIKPLLSNIKATIFHFGFKPEQSLIMFTAYVKNMFAWLFWAGAAGLLLFFVQVKEFHKRRWLYFFGWGGLSAILILYYGSWKFFDNPDPTSFTIGNSYTRYWLPFYLGALPFASLALIKITALARQRLAVWALRLIAVAIVATLSIQFIWFEPSEGLAISIDKQKAARLEANQVLTLTEENAAVITRYHDKVLFPERKVIIGLFDDQNMIREYARLTRYLPVYYYNFSFTPEDINYLNAGPLAKEGIGLKFIKQVTPKFSLYKLYAVQQ